MKRQSNISSFLFPAFCLFCGVAFATATQEISPVQAPDPSDSIVLTEALKLVFGKTPELAVSELEIEAAAGRLLQAGLRPNPEFAAIGENILSMGGSGLFPYTESTFQLSQRLELGGKRDKRIVAAEKEIGIAKSLMTQKRAELFSLTSQAFAEVLASQERLKNQRELSRLAREAHSAVLERVAAGKVSPVEQTRATVALASAELEEEKQAKALLAAKDRLAALWGGSNLDFGTVRGRFEIPSPLTGAELRCLADNPEIGVAAAAVDSQKALLLLEKSMRTPDLTVSAGFRYLNLENQGAWVAGVALPIPFFDKRQGAIAEAQARIRKSASEKTAVEWRLRAAFTQARHDYEIATLEATTLTRTALPAAKDASAAMEEGYRFGKFDFLNVLDAQRTYAELQRHYIEAVASGLKAAIEIDRIAHCGPHFPELSNRSQEEVRP